MVESTIQRCFEITHFRRKIQQILEFQKVENQTVQLELRKPLYRIRDQYATAPVDKLFGNFMKHRTLSDTNRSTSLDTMFQMDREEMLWRIHTMLCERIGLSTDIYRFDSTNFPFYGVAYEDYSDGASPRYSKTSKT